MLVMERNMKNKERGQGREREGTRGGGERESDEAAKREGTETGLLFERRRTLGLCTKWRIITDPKQTRYVSH